MIYYQRVLCKWKYAKSLFISLDQAPVLPFKWSLLISVIQNATNPLQGYCFTFYRISLTCVLCVSSLNWARHSICVTWWRPLLQYRFHSMCAYERVGCQRQRSNISWAKHFFWDLLQMSVCVIFTKSLLGRYFIPHWTHEKNWGLHHLLTTVIVLCIVKPGFAPRSLLILDISRYLVCVLSQEKGCNCYMHNIIFWSEYTIGIYYSK